MSVLILKINTKEFERLTVGELQKNFAKAGIFFASKLRGFLNVSQPYTRGKHFHGHAPSAPGEYPRKLTGQLQKSITWHLDKAKTVLTVGSNLKGYPSYLQTGTQFMKPRPWLTLAWNAEKTALARILVNGK